MKIVNMHEAKTHLSRLVEAATKGEPFIIARAGKPLVEVRAVADAPKPQLFGFLKGEIEWDDELDKQLDEEIRKEFEESIARGLFPEAPVDSGGEDPSGPTP